MNYMKANANFFISVNILSTGGENKGKVRVMETEKGWKRMSG